METHHQSFGLFGHKVITIKSVFLNSDRISVLKGKI